MVKLIDPMLQAALDRLGEIGPTWKADEAARWAALFIATVELIYPAKKPRVRRKAAAE